MACCFQFLWRMLALPPSSKFGLPPHSMRQVHLAVTEIQRVYRGYSARKRHQEEAEGQQRIESITIGIAPEEGDADLLF